MSETTAVTLVDRLREAINEDERQALATRDTTWSVEPYEPSDQHALPTATWVVSGPAGENGIAMVQGSFRADHIVRHDPARVLRQVAAKRKVLEVYEEAKAYYDDHKTVPAGEAYGLWIAILALAEGYGIEVE